MANTKKPKKPQKQQKMILVKTGGKTKDQMKADIKAMARAAGLLK
jgi:hypothetical protein